MDAPPSSPSLGKILESYTVNTLGGSRKKSKSNKGLGDKELKINLGCHQVYPWCILPCLSGRTGRDE